MPIMALSATQATTASVNFVTVILIKVESLPLLRTGVQRARLLFLVRSDLVQSQLTVVGFVSAPSKLKNRVCRYKRKIVTW
jgi:hypothetical protein